MKLIIFTNPIKFGSLVSAHCTNNIFKKTHCNNDEGYVEDIIYISEDGQQFAFDSFNKEKLKQYSITILAEENKLGDIVNRISESIDDHFAILCHGDTKKFYNSALEQLQQSPYYNKEIGTIESHEESEWEGKETPYCKIAKLIGNITNSDTLGSLLEITDKLKEQEQHKKELNAVLAFLHGCLVEYPKEEDYQKLKDAEMDISNLPKLKGDPLSEEYTKSLSDLRDDLLEKILSTD